MPLRGEPEGRKEDFLYTLYTSYYYGNILSGVAITITIQNKTNTLLGGPRALGGGIPHHVKPLKEEAPTQQSLHSSHIFSKLAAVMRIPQVPSTPGWLRAMPRAMGSSSSRCRPQNPQSLGCPDKANPLLFLDPHSRSPACSVPQMALTYEIRRSLLPTKHHFLQATPIWP